MDVIALAGTTHAVCAAVLRYRDGRLTDKREFLFRDTTDIDAVREEFLPQYYLDGETIPKTIAVDALPPDAEALNEALNQARGTKVELYVPQRGDVAKLVTMAYTNAVERLGRESGRYTREEKLLEEAAQVLGLKKPPRVIESYDISNWGDGSSVCGMVVFQDGKPHRAGYRRFKMKTVAGTDDYASLAETLSRRAAEYEMARRGEKPDGPQNQFATLPDLLLIDGGVNHANVAVAALEELGLLKMDFLGLRNLTVLDDAVKMVQARQPDFTLADIPEGDPETYKMLSDGKTVGVFQMESTGMTGVCVGLKPQSIEDITAIIALYRPGPMDSIPKFIACKHDPSKVTYLIPQLEPILSITYGCIVYQEQVIQIFQQLAGYSLGQADMLRRAMSKKKVKDIEREREAFLHGDPARNISGCVANGIDEKAAQEIYEEIYAFANYAFNKAHAAAYAVVAYQTAYFKCHYTKEYMAALLSSVLDSSDKEGEYFAECRESGIKLLPPDVNHSADRFTVEPEGIRFGLVAIKNIGRGLILRMMQERELNGPFVDFQDFCRRMDGMEINKRAVENLIRAGAFDSTGAKRSQLIAVYEKVMDGIAEGNRTNVEGQIDFFGMGAETAQHAALVLPDIPEFTPQELMAMEKATTGLYLTGHPMDAYRSLVRSSGAAAIGRVMEDFAQEAGPTTFSDGQKISLAGVVTASKTKMTKKNTLMAYVTLEDGTGAIEMLCFTRALEQYGSYLQEGQVIYVTGTLSVRDEKAPQLMCDFARPLNANFSTGTAAPAQAPQQRTGQTLYLRLPSVDGPEMAILRKILYMFEGKENNVRIRVLDTGKLIGTTCDLHTSLVCDLEERFGKENVVVK